MPGGPRPKAGRKAIKIDPAELEKLCALQCTDLELAAWFGVSVRTIERRRKRPAFAQAIERGKAKGRLSLRRSLWALAVKGNPAANIFLAKKLLGYTDLLRNEHTGPDSGPIYRSITVRFVRPGEKDIAETSSKRAAASDAPFDSARVH